MSTPQSHADRIPLEEVRADIRIILWSIGLHSVRRYIHQHYWEEETREAENADEVAPLPRLESVSEHSWHVADIILLLAGHFPQLDRNRCLELAILHDKLELITGDMSPMGTDGTGSKTYAFDEKSRKKKDQQEVLAMGKYLKNLRTAARIDQKNLLIELQEGTTEDARFVKAIDKLQPLAFIHWKREGRLSDSHLIFTARYSRKCIEYFPDLTPHYNELLDVFMRRVAKQRKTAVSDIYEIIGDI